MKSILHTHCTWCLLFVIIVYDTCDAQICGTAGSLEHNGMMQIVQPSSTYLLPDYIMPCNGTVYSWEFCYLRSSTNPARFYPSIWRPSDTNTHRLVDISRITYMPTVGIGTQCLNHTVPDSEQFNVLAGDIIGLYSDVNSQLASYPTSHPMFSYIYLNSNRSETVDNIGRSSTDRIIAIKVYLTTAVIPVAVNNSITPTVSTNIQQLASTAVTDQINTTSSTGDQVVMMITSALLEATNVLSTNLFNGAESVTITISVTTNAHEMNNTFTPSVSTNAVLSKTPSVPITSTHVISSTITTSNIPDQEDSDTVGAIVGGILGAIIVFIAIIIVIIIVFIVSRKKRAKNYQISRQALTTDRVVYNKKLESVKHQIHTLNSGSSSAQSYLTPVAIGCGIQHSVGSNDMKGTQFSTAVAHAQPYNAMGYKQPLDATGYVQPDSGPEVYANPGINKATQSPTALAQEQPYVVAGYAQPYDAAGYVQPLLISSTPNSTDKVYADPGNKKDDIFHWLKENKVCQIISSDIRVCEKIGSGQFGIVNRGLWFDGSPDPVQVAVKTLNSQCSESDRVKFLREAAIMGQFVHNNVVQLHGVVTEEKNLMIVLEYMPKGDLKKFLKSNKERFSSDKLPKMLLNFCRQIAAGMNYLANKQFVHRDLAARNVLVSNDDVCKIADFGMARDVVDDTFYTASGGKVPVKWTAIEAVTYNKYSVMSDVWSFGCVMYEVWSLGHSPFEKVHYKEYLKHIVNGQRLPPPPGCSRALYKLMMQCWHPEAKERPKPMIILNRLHDLNMSQLDSEDEKLTKLGDALSTSEQLYTDLQELYITNND